MIRKKISVIIPCHNEAENIFLLYDRLTITLNSITKEYEIIFVENGSTDKSWQILSDLSKKDKHVIVIKLSRGGFDSAWGPFSAGMVYATGDAIVNMDGDGEDPPEVISKFIDKWQQGYDIVYGIRKSRKVSYFMNISYKAFYRIMKKISYVEMPLDAGEFSLMDRKVVNAINSLPEKDRYIRGLRAWVGFKSIGVGYARQKRLHGKTSNSFTDNLTWSIKAITSFSYAPLVMITVISFITFSVSFIGIIYYFFAHFFSDKYVPGFTSIILLILFLGSVQLLAISIIGGYIAKITREVQARPPYIIDEIVGQEIDAKTI